MCSFKVLAHVQGIRSAALEMARVLKPGGVLIAEFYNPRSVRGAIWSVKQGGKTGGDGQSERDVYVRFDTPRQARGYFPEGMEWVESYGLRVVTPLPVLHKLPLVADALQTLEHGLARPLAPLGSFYGWCSGSCAGLLTDRRADAGRVRSEQPMPRRTPQQG